MFGNIRVLLISLTGTYQNFSWLARSVVLRVSKLQRLKQLTLKWTQITKLKFNLDANLFLKFYLPKKQLSLCALSLLRFLYHIFF